VNAGAFDAPFASAVVTRSSVELVSFEGVEHLDSRWSDVGDAFLDRWWREHVSMDHALARRASRTFRLHGAVFDDGDRVELRALLDAQSRARIVCATRASGLATSADAINARLLARLQGASGVRPSRALVPGVPVMVLRNDYERGLFNGDSGLVVSVDPGDAVGPRPMAVFPRRTEIEAIPLDVDLAPAFAMTVHKAQGSEFDNVTLVLPEADLPMVTRELLYTAMTRARRSVLIVGQRELLARAVARTAERYSGVARRLKN
jgi:exodeoxyribonuclease V alpha subunit